MLLQRIESMRVANWHQVMVMYDSIVGKTVTMKGGSSLRYNEALGSGGAINNYRIVSWFADSC